MSCLRQSPHDRSWRSAADRLHSLRAHGGGSDRPPQASEEAVAGAVQAHDTKQEAREALVNDWMADRQRDPSASRMLLAYTRADAAELNRLAREALRSAGQLGPGRTVDTRAGPRAFAAGDRVMFLRNERSLGVKNGSLGTLTALSRSWMEVRLDDARTLRFDRRDYADLTHGYAATIHKMQGATVDRAWVLASRHMDRHAAYVALSRHRDTTMLRYGRDEFAGREDLVRALERQEGSGRLSENTDGAGDQLGPPCSIVAPGASGTSIEWLSLTEAM